MSARREASPVSTFFFWTLLHARRSLTTKLVVVACLIPALLWLNGDRFSVTSLNGVAEGLVTGLLPLMALLYGSGVIREEVEQQTLTYSLIRPLPRQLLYASRLLAAALPLAASVIPGILVISVLSDNRMSWVSLSAAATLGAFAYVALFALVGQFARRPLGVGLIFMVWESGASKVPGIFGEMTLTRHVGTFAGIPQDIIMSSGEVGNPWLALAALIVITGALIAIGAEVTARRGFTLPR